MNADDFLRLAGESQDLAYRRPSPYKTVPMEVLVPVRFECFIEGCDEWRASARERLAHVTRDHGKGRRA